MRTRTPVTQNVQETIIAGITVPGTATPDNRTVHVLSVVRFAAGVRALVELHALWRPQRSRFGLETSIVGSHELTFISAQMTGPFLLSVTDSGTTYELRLHRTAAVDNGLTVEARCPEIPQRSGSVILNDYPDLRQSVGLAMPRAIERQVELAFRAMLEQNSPAMPLMTVSIGKSENGRALMEQCTRGEFDALWAANVYAEVEESGPVTRIMNASRTVQAQLPYLDKKQWKRAARFFARAVATVTDTGEILVDAPVAGLPVLPEAAVEGQELCQESMIHASQERRHRRPSNVSLRAPLKCSLDQAKYLVPADVWIQAEAFAASQCATQRNEIECEYSLSIPRYALEAWFCSPPASSWASALTYREVSLAIQAAMRRWLPSFWSAPSSKLPSRMAALMTRLYGYSDPHVGTARADVVPDWMSVACLDRVWRSGVCTLRKKLTEEKLITLRTTHQARLYAERQTEMLSEWTWRGRLLPAILHKEAALIESMIQFGTACRDLEESGQICDAVATRRTMQRTLRGVKRALRRFYLRLDYSVLLPLVLVEATNALNRAIDRDYQVTTTLTLRAPSGAEKKISHQAANFSFGRH